MISRELGDRRGEGNTLGDLGLAYADLGDVWRAIQYYEEALAIHREIGDRRGEGHGLGNLGIAYTDLGEARQAIEYLEQALAISREIGDRHAEERHLANMGAAYEKLGEARRAGSCGKRRWRLQRRLSRRMRSRCGIGWRNSTKRPACPSGELSLDHVQSDPKIVLRSSLAYPRLPTA